MILNYFFVSIPKIQFQNLIFLFIILQVVHNYLFQYALLIDQRLLDNDQYKTSHSHLKTYYWIQKSLKQIWNLKFFEYAFIQA